MLCILIRRILRLLAHLRTSSQNWRLYYYCFLIRVPKLRQTSQNFYRKFFPHRQGNSMPVILFWPDEISDSRSIRLFLSRNRCSCSASGFLLSCIPFYQPALNQHNLYNNFGLYDKKRAAIRPIFLCCLSVSQHVEKRRCTAITCCATFVNQT